MSKERVRDLELAAERLTHVRPTVEVIPTTQGYCAMLVVASTMPCASQEDALRSLSKKVATMLVSNIDHDAVFRARLSSDE